MLPENQESLIKSLLEQVSKLADEVNNLKREIPTGEELMKEISITKNAGFVIKPFKSKRKRGNGAIPLLVS